MNDQRSVNERFTLQSISKHLGFPDWRKLEAVAEGRSDVSAAELVNVARALGISGHWLLEGKQTPFLVDPEDYRGAEEQFESIQRLNPRRIVFVRQREEAAGLCASERSGVGCDGSRMVACDAARPI